MNIPATYLLPLSLVLLPSLALGQPSPSRKNIAVSNHTSQSVGHREADRQAVIGLYRAMNRAMVAADVAALDKMLAPDYTLTHITGYTQSRAEWLSQVKSGEMRYFKTEEDSVEVSIDGNTATLTGRSRTTTNIWGAHGTWPLQLRIALRHINGRWLMEKAVASTY